MRQRRLALAGLAALALLVVGCATPPPARHVGDRTPDFFVIEGRFSLRDRDSAQQGRLRWRHEPAGETLLVQDPLGGGVAELATDDYSARIALADGTVRSAATAETLMAELTGIALPVRDLARWLSGRGHPQRDIERDGAGRATRLNTSGWRLRYEYPEDDPSADLLPIRVVAINDTGIEMRLAIESWSFTRD